MHENVTKFHDESTYLAGNKLVTKDLKSCDLNGRTSSILIPGTSKVEKDEAFTLHCSPM